MRFQGGKSRIASKIAAHIPVGPWWEPFCGGANVTPHLAAKGPGLASDSNAALVSMYRAAQGGWVAPVEMSRDAYAAARLLPDSDPLKAFAGTACSFGGKWFGGYASEGRRPIGVIGCGGAGSGSRCLARQISRCSGVFFECASFFARLPAAGVFASIYCDPPYAGVTGYRGERFPHAAFWDRCQAWARKGARVFVSEYGCPVPHRVVEVFRKAVDLGPRKTVDDILFEVLA